jgi:hypothetical protein
MAQNPTTTTEAPSTPGNVALTTAFVPPASCLASTEFYQLGTTNQQFYIQGPRAAQNECFPPSYTVGPSTSRLYSPAANCPSGYTSACNRMAVTNKSEVQTKWVCCPT